MFLDIHRVYLLLLAVLVSSVHSAPTRRPPKPFAPPPIAVRPTAPRPIAPRPQAAGLPAPPRPGAPPAPPRPDTPPPAAKTISGNGWTYTLKEIIEDGPSPVWSLTDPSRIAKQFKTQDPSIGQAQGQAFAREFAGTYRALGDGWITGGPSIISNTGDGAVSTWLVIPSLNGRGFKNQPWWRATKGNGRRACKSTLKRVRDEFQTSLLTFHRKTELIQLNTSLANTIWNSQMVKVDGFVSFARVETLDELVLRRTGAQPGQTSNLAKLEILNQYAATAAQEQYPGSLCPDPVRGGANKIKDDHSQLMSFN